MGPVTRAVQTGIGLAAELKAAHKERKSLAEDNNNGEIAKTLEAIAFVAYICRSNERAHSSSRAIADRGKG